jgi:hypothetical protein
MRVSRSLAIVLAAILVAAGASALGLQHLDNSRLRRQIAQQLRMAEQAADARAENRQLRALVDAGQSSANVAAAARDQLALARKELADLERRAELVRVEQRGRSQPDFESLATNRDPTRAQTRAEYFEAKGQATPTDTIQTAIWAALKGDAATLAKTCTMTPATRAQAEQLIARLPVDARQQWTPEKLAALWMVAAFNEVPALQLTGEKFMQADEATVYFRLYGKTDEEHINLKRRADGWQLILPSNAIEIEQRVRGAESR